MDGFDGSEVVMAATNRPEILDPAPLRAGRFDRRVTVNPPDTAGREQILALHTAGLARDGAGPSRNRAASAEPARIVACTDRRPGRFQASIT